MPETSIVFITVFVLISVLASDMVKSGPAFLAASVVLAVCGIISPAELMQGFTNTGMITVGLLFLVAEGVRRSGALACLTEKLLPERPKGVRDAQLRILPCVAAMSAFLNNTPIVVILSPMLKRWAAAKNMPASKFLIPLSYATILGGMCTLVGTSTNLIVNGMMQAGGHPGFGMFELGKVGLFITLAGMLYMAVFADSILPDTKTVGGKPHYGHTVSVQGRHKNNDKGKSALPWQRYIVLVLLVAMVAGTTLSQLPIGWKLFGGKVPGMLFFAAVAAVAMLAIGVIPLKRCARCVSWDVLLTIACALSVSKAMENSGLVSLISREIMSVGGKYGPHILLALVFMITNAFTEVINNNAAAAMAFPLSSSLAGGMGVSAMPFFVAICIAASSSFSTPMGYQTNMIVREQGRYRFMDYVRMGLPLNAISFLVSMALIPVFWPF